MAPRPPLPRSDTNLWVNLLGFASCCGALAWVHFHAPDMDVLTLSLVCMVATALPILFFDVVVFRVWRNPSTRLGASRPVDPRRVAVKWLGLLATFAGLAFLYWLFPEYRQDFYDRYYALMRYAVPALLAFAIPYFWLLDARMREPHDGYWHVGLCILGRARDADLAYVGRHFRDWLVKGFFFPLMFTYVGGNALAVIRQDYSLLTGFIPVYDYLYNFIFFADLMFAVVGYAMTLVVLDTHIRSSEPTVFGWVVAIMCYSPFWQAVFYNSYFAYDDNYYWGHWFAGRPTMQVLWGSAILALITVYSLATVCLGYRFSNLTYRGLVANGPYRFTKHPAYVTKNLSWWLISIPFLSQQGPSEALRHCLMLGGVNLLYFFRARTEERHLSRYPEYVEYALAMNERSVFRGLGRVFPWLQFRAPPSAT